MSLTRLLPIVFVCVLACSSATAQSTVPASFPGDDRPVTKPLAEFDFTPVVKWDRNERWSFGGSRFKKLDEFYQPFDPKLVHPWMISTVDFDTAFQQFVIDSFAPSFAPLIGDKTKDLQTFLESHKRGSGVRFVFSLTDKKLVFYHDKGLKTESKFECAVVEGGFQKYFAGPKPEHFTQVDDVTPEEAYASSMENFKARIEWARKIREYVAKKYGTGK